MLFHIVGNKKCGHLDLLYAKVGAKVGVKVATLHTGLLFRDMYCSLWECVLNIAKKTRFFPITSVPYC